MNIKASMLCLAVSALLASPICQADLSNKTYQAGKAAYHKEDFGTAAELLQKYQNEDRQFLQAHPSIRDAIVAAVAYCTEYQSTHIRAASAGIETGRPPELP